MHKNRKGICMAPPVKIAPVELSDTMKDLFDTNYRKIFDRYNESVEEGIRDFDETHSLLVSLFKETKEVYDSMGSRNIMVKVEMGKILTDLLKQRSALTKDKFNLIDKSSTTMAGNLKLLENVALKKDDKSAFDPISQFNAMNKMLDK